MDGVNISGSLSFLFFLCSWEGPKIDLFGKAHVKVEFIPVLKIYTITLPLQFQEDLPEEQILYNCSPVTKFLPQFTSRYKLCAKQSEPDKMNIHIQYIHLKNMSESNLPFTMKIMKIRRRKFKNRVLYVLLRTRIDSAGNLKHQKAFYFVVLQSNSFNRKSPIGKIYSILNEIDLTEYR